MVTMLKGLVAGAFFMFFSSACLSLLLSLFLILPLLWGPLHHLPAHLPFPSSCKSMVRPAPVMACLG